MSEFFYDEHNFKKFSQLAINKNLSESEKMGFGYGRDGKFEERIFKDILKKCQELENKRNLRILDIGCGCSILVKKMIDIAKIQDHELYLLDSKEMLKLLPNNKDFYKIFGAFPDIYEKVKNLCDSFDIIICYSVFQYIFVERPVWHFLDCVMSLINEGGKVLIGDIPNISKRKRFFASNNGIKFHQKFMNTNEVSNVKFNCIEFSRIDDALLMSMIGHCQLAGFNAYLLPQESDLPFSNCRDDILIMRP